MHPSGSQALTPISTHLPPILPVTSASALSLSNTDDIPIDPVLLQLSVPTGPTPSTPQCSRIEPHQNGAISSSMWPSDIYSLHRNFRLSQLPAESNAQIESIRHLLAKYGIECIQTHQFEWMRYATGPIKEEWLPIYTYHKGLSVRQIWEEWAEGMGEHLSVRQLCEGWGARWRRNVQGQKTEASRRKHITDLITKLSNKTNWSLPLALRFLEEKYPIPGPDFLASPTAFAKRLQNKAAGAKLLEDIMDNASNYCR